MIQDNKNAMATNAESSITKMLLIFIIYDAIVQNYPELSNSISLTQK